jgi:hypothetical protein
MKRSLLSVLLLALLIAIPVPAWSQESRKLNSREVGQIFFDALLNGDLKVVKGHRVKGAEKLSQEELDDTRAALVTPRIVVKTAWQSQLRHRALVVSSEISVRRLDDKPGEAGQFVLDMDDTLGQWQVKEIGFHSDDVVTETVDEFRKKYLEDAREVPAPVVAMVQKKQKRKLIVFPVKFADVTAVSGILAELFSEIPVVVDERTNSLFVRCDEERQKEELRDLEEVLELLDQPTEEKRKPKKEKRGENFSGGSTGNVDVEAIYAWLESEIEAEYVAEVRDGAAQAEAASVTRASSIRDQLKGKDDPARKAELRQQLRNLVEESFIARQSLQKAELVLLRQRLAQIASQIESREKIRKRIIDRRVEELLDPALKWKPSAVIPTPPAGGSGTPSLGGPAGLQQTVSPQALVQSGGGGPSGLPGQPTRKATKVQVLFRNPAGTKIIWSAGKNLSSLVVPARINLTPGTQHGFTLAEIQGREGQQIAGSIQIVAPTVVTAAFIRHNAIPLQFSDDDFDQVTSGNLVTKAVFLPDPEFQELAIAGVETLVSTSLDSGVDPVTEADKRGAILAILRLGNRVEAATPIGVAPGVAPADDEADLSLDAKIQGGSGILFFESESCSVCEKLRPEFTKHMSKVGLPFLPIDVLKHPQIAKRFRVSSTPTFVWVTSDVELERAVGSEYQPLVDKFATYWEEMGGARSGLGFGGGLRGFLRKELVAARAGRESTLTDIIALELSMAEIGDPIEPRNDLPKENREQIEKENSLKKEKQQLLQDRITSIRKELKPHEARIELIQKRLKELDSGTAANSDPQSAVVWIEALIEHASVNGTRNVTATYMNGTVISSQGHIAVCAGPGSTEEEVRKAVVKLTVNLSDRTSHQGRLLAYDTQSGAAVIKIEAAGLNCLKICDDPIADGRRLDVFALVQGNTPSPVKAPVYVVDTRFKVGDHAGFFAVAEASQTSLNPEFMGAPIVTTSGQLQGILAENEAVLYGPAIQPEDPKPRRAAAIPANVIRRLLSRISEPQPDTAAPEKPAAPVE